MKTMIAKGVAPLVAAMLLSACGVTPVFKQPQLAAPAAFKEARPGVQVARDGTRWQQARAAEQQPRGEWWLAFSDPALTKMIVEAGAANQNLAVAAARVKQARAIAGIAGADRSPQIGFGAGAQRGNAPGQGGAATTYQAQLTASYEVDLFGRVAANVSAARNDAASAEANLRSVRLAVQADVAQNWFRLRTLDAELVTLNENVRLLEENVKVNGRRFELGDIGEFDLARAKTELARRRADAIGLQRERADLEHALAVLMGKPPAAVALADAPLASSGTLPVIPAGLPSTLLERRPDIAAAQRTMEAANARIGVARAAMFPAISIGASGGGVGGALSDVFKMSSKSWLLGALLSVPLLDGGRNKQNVARTEAVLEESVADYRQKVLVAFSEVEDNLAGLRILSAQTEQVDAALASARRSAELADKLYRAGRSSYLDLLDAQRNLADVERSAVQLRGNQAVTTVALIRSLGGGWDAAPAR